MSHRDVTSTLTSSVGASQWVGVMYNISNLTGNGQQLSFKIMALCFCTFLIFFCEKLHCLDGSIAMKENFCLFVFIVCLLIIFKKATSTLVVPQKLSFLAVNHPQLHWHYYQ